jgi:hypothetical protein
VKEMAFTNVNMSPVMSTPGGALTARDAQRVGALAAVP